MEIRVCSHRAVSQRGLQAGGARCSYWGGNHLPHCWAIGHCDYSRVGGRTATLPAWRTSVVPVLLQRGVAFGRPRLNKENMYGVRIVPSDAASTRPEGVPGSSWGEQQGSRVGKSCFPTLHGQDDPTRARWARCNRAECRASRRRSADGQGRKELILGETFIHPSRSRIGCRVPSRSPSAVEAASAWRHDRPSWGASASLFPFGRCCHRHCT